MIELRKVLIPDIPLDKQNEIAKSIKKRKDLINKLEVQINSESNLIKDEIENLIDYRNMDAWE